MGDTILHRGNLAERERHSTRDSGVLRSRWTLLEHAAFWGIVSQFAVFFLGLEPLAPLLTAGPVILIGAAGLFRRRTVPHWLAILWLASMIGVLMQMLAVFGLRGIGGWYLPGWLLTFALAAFLPLAGAMVRPEIVFYASAILGIQALIYSVVAGMAVSAGLDPSYNSPIPVTRLIDSSFHVVRLIQPIGIAGGERRLLAFTPFPTSAGAVACIFALLSLCHRRSWTKGIAMAGWLLLLLLTGARTGIICAALGIPFYFLLLLPRRYLFLGAGAALILATALTGPILRAADLGYGMLREQRSASSHDRANLRRLAMDGWRYGGNSVMGAGVSVPGGPIVHNVGIGTHDFVGANLFIRGALGFGLTLLPVMVTLIFGFFAGFTPAERIGTTIAVVLLAYTYSQELQTLYVHIWPIFLVVGAMGIRRRGASLEPVLAKI